MMPMRTARLLATVVSITAVVVAPVPVVAQDLPFPSAALTDSGQLHRVMPVFARAVLARLYSDTGADPDTRLNTAFRLQMVAGDQASALATLAELRALRRVRDLEFAPSEYTQYALYASTIAPTSVSAAATFAERVPLQFRTLDASASDRVAARIAASFTFDLGLAEGQLQRALDARRGHSTVSLDDAVALCRAYHVVMVYRALLPVMPPVLRAAETRRYDIEEHARVPLRDGNALTAVVVRPRRLLGPQPAVLEFTLYANEQNRASAMEAASQGFVGIVATTRGKRGSAGAVVPWEHDATDAYDLIDWISRQSWSNGSVGMLGGRYAGFTQWAAAKRLHPALKTIVPSAAVAPGVDFPRENGVVLNFQSRWAPWVTNDSLLDDASYHDEARWNALDSTWFARGTAYRNLDALDGVPNRPFRRWLDHPERLTFWRSQSGFEVDFLIGDSVAIEVQSETRASKDSIRGLKALAEEGIVSHLLLVCREEESRVMDGVQILPWREFLENLWSGRYL